MFGISKTKIKGVLLVKPEVFRDDRGLFIETYSEKKYFEKGLKEKFVQDNYSHSKKNTIRGLHYQLKNPQGKLVRVLRGKVLDVVVDIRQGFPTFGENVSVILDDTNFNQLYMPHGIAHGFFVISESVDFEYKCTDYYYPEDQYGIAYNDPFLDIKFPSDQVIISSQDKSFLPLKDVPKNLLPSLI